MMNSESNWKTFEPALREVVDALPIGIVILAENASGNVSWRNRAAAELIRKDPNRLKNAFVNLTSVCPDEELEIVLDPGRTELPVRIRAGARSREGRPVSVVIEDLSSQRALKREAVAQLLGGMAHELNNPLGAIRLHRDIIANVAEGLSLAAPSPDWGDLEESTASISECVDRIEATISGLRGLANANRPCESASVDLEELVRRVTDELGPRARKAGVKVVLDSEGSPARIVADREQLTQGIHIVLLNAIDAAAVSDERKVWLHLRRAGGGLELQIMDSGPGIPEANRRRLFDPFFTTKRAGRGIGLGLSVAREIIRANGGVLSFRERKDERTSFVIGIPDRIQVS